MSPPPPKFDVENEIIVGENVDDLGALYNPSVANEQIIDCVDTVEDSSRPRGLQVSPLPSISEPVRVFRSGVLRLSSISTPSCSAATGPVTVGVVPSLIFAPPSFHDDQHFDNPSQAAFGQSTTPNFSPLQQSEPLTDESTLTPSNSFPPAASETLHDPIFNYEIEAMDGSPQIFQPSDYLVTEHSPIQIPISPSDKARRVLSSRNSAVISISMRGSIDLVNVRPSRFVARSQEDIYLIPV